MKNPKVKSPKMVTLPFDEQLSRSQVSQVVIELIKSTIFLRNQIPMAIETLRRDIQEFNQEKIADAEESKMSEESDVCGRRHRDQIRQRNANIRKQKLRNKFIKLAEKFLNQYEIFEKLVHEVLIENSSQQEVREIAFTLGLTSGAPKEVYIVHLPEECGQESGGVDLDRRKIIRIFRSVMYEFEVIGSECSMSNMFLAFKMNSKMDHPASDQLFPKEFENWPPQRSSVTHFFIKHNIAHEPTGTDSYTPSAMQLCTTPYPVAKQWQKVRYASEDSTLSFDQMVETPVQKTNCISRITGGGIDLDKDGNTIGPEELAADEYKWFYCNSVLKGFRDPQVKRGE